MPKAKKQSRTKNLGQFATKRKCSESRDSDDAQPNKHLRNISPDPASMDQGSDSERNDAQSTLGGVQLIQPDGDNSTSEDGNEPGIEIYEEDDIPHPKDYTDLAQWLKLSDAHLAALHTRISVRGEQELRKAEKERQERGNREDMKHRRQSTQISHFFARTQPAPIERDPESPGRVVSKPSTSRVTVEDVENDDDDYLTVEPCQLSPEALAEEGLDQLPWDPSQDITPRAPDAPVPVEQPLPPNPPVFPPPQSLPPGSATYFHHAQGFTLPNRPRPWKIPTPLPSNTSVDTAIENLQNILHPHRKTGWGHQKTNLDIVTTARLECIIRFLRLYKGAGYAGWTLHSETIATASGKSGSKTWLARKIRQWTIDFCEDSRKIPSHMYGRFNSSILADEDVAGDIHLHLQLLGNPPQR
ncbi:hypothetical protein B0H17DRAFT_1147588 [Mycena rosella]|uniref:Uncharacterized protein n=1 Tax=Mycena rosella TaxID=1033263 RepID=A0AAD7CLI1_MYCRO|nr:hypothetical protein B0H17DRAFT_1147588 [Mycena rosella]